MTFSIAIRNAHEFPVDWHLIARLFATFSYINWRNLRTDIDITEAEFN